MNMIAQFIAQQKRVLFVSEKIAALDVVYRRLREVGLGEFCLEVHSSKSKKPKSWPSCTRPGRHAVALIQKPGRSRPNACKDIATS